VINWKWRGRQQRKIEGSTPVFSSINWGKPEIFSQDGIGDWVWTGGLPLRKQDRLFQLLKPHPLIRAVTWHICTPEALLTESYAVLCTITPHLRCLTKSGLPNWIPWPLRSFTLRSHVAVLPSISVYVSHRPLRLLTFGQLEEGQCKRHNCVYRSTYYWSIICAITLRISTLRYEKRGLFWRKWLIC